jgi:lysophospholipid acyltransferase (LPLAT)-like uncharacterized protein
MVKAILRHPRAQWLLGHAAALYLRLVRATSTITIDPPDAYERVGPELPVIIAMWHGEHFMVPFAKRAQDRVRVLISLHRDGEINAVAAEAFGVPAIRGSGSHGLQSTDKRGAAAFLEMMRSLGDGWTVASTADVPKVSRVAGMGIVKLALKSGRAIYPVAVVSSRRMVMERSWDKSKVPLPFGRIVMCLGQVIRVAPNADDAALQAARSAVQASLNAATERAYALADRKESPQ